MRSSNKLRANNNHDPIKKLTDLKDGICKDILSQMIKSYYQKVTYCWYKLEVLVLTKDRQFKDK
jgi:hypothetical protein